MASTSETGHAKNVATFEDLISFCTAYGATYNPSKAALKLPALTTQNTGAIAALQAVKVAKTAFDNATNTRGTNTFSNTHHCANTNVKYNSPLKKNLKKSVDNVTLAMKSKIDLRGKMASKESERNSETGVSWKSQWWSLATPNTIIIKIISRHPIRFLNNSLHQK